MCKSYSKPKMKFLKPRLAVGYEGNILTYFIGVYNEIPTGWRQEVCQRHVAIGCKAEVEFSIEGKFLTNAIWWDTELGEIIYPDSKVHEFPLVSYKSEIDKPHEESAIFLEGTQASTASPIPSLKIPPKTDIMAKVMITSPSLRDKIISIRYQS